MWIINHYLHYHFVLGKSLQAYLRIGKTDEVEADEPHWN